MTFAEWWDTLTEAEHKLIGKTNAAFVWLCATQAEREACAKIADTWKDNVVWEARTVADNIGREIRNRKHT